MFFCGNPTDLHFYRVIQLFKTDVLFQGGHHSRFHIKPYNSSWEVCHGRPYLMCFVIVFCSNGKTPSDSKCPFSFVCWGLKPPTSHRFFVIHVQLLQEECATYSNHRQNTMLCVADVADICWAGRGSGQEKGGGRGWGLFRGKSRLLKQWTWNIFGGKVMVVVVVLVISCLSRTGTSSSSIT